MSAYVLPHKPNIFAVISAILCTAIIIAGMSGCAPPQEPQDPDPPYLFMNANNGGLLSYDKSQIVYLGSYEPYYNAIILSGFDLMEKRLILPDRKNEIYTLFLDNSVVYYTLLRDDYTSAIGSVNINGSGKRILLETDVLPEFLTVQDGYLYFIHSGSICRYCVEDGEEEVLTDGIRCRYYFKHGDTIYYSTDDEIGKLTLSTGVQEVIAEIPLAESLTVYNGYLYFLKYRGEKLYRMELSSGRVDELAGKRAVQFIIDSDKIYFIDKLEPWTMRGIYEEYKNNYNAEDFGYLLSEFDDDFYYEGILFQVDLDGSGLKLVETDSLFSCLLFAAPGHKYVTKSFMDVIEPLNIKE